MQIDHWNLHKTDEEVKAMALDWITQPRPDWSNNDEKIYGLIHKYPHKALAIACAVIQITEDEDDVGLLSAGIIEDLLVVHGETMLDDFTKLAHQHEKFRTLLTGVWPYRLPKVLGQKIRALSISRL